MRHCVHCVNEACICFVISRMCSSIVEDWTLCSPETAVALVMSDQDSRETLFGGGFSNRTHVGTARRRGQEPDAAAAAATRRDGAPPGDPPGTRDTLVCLSLTREDGTSQRANL